MTIAVIMDYLTRHEVVILYDILELFFGLDSRAFSMEKREEKTPCLIIHLNASSCKPKNIVYIKAVLFDYLPQNDGKLAHLLD